MTNVVVFPTDGEDKILEGFPSSVKYRNAYAYHIETKLWYMWKFYSVPNWVPLNTTDVPENIRSKLRIILLILN